MQNTTAKLLFLVIFSDFLSIFYCSAEAAKNRSGKLPETVLYKLSGKLLFQADPCEVVVPAPDLRMVRFDGPPVILTLGFFVLAVHTQDLVIVHAHDPAAVQRLSAPIAVLNFKKSVSHCYNSFC